MAKTQTQDDLGTRMKDFEFHETSRRAMARLPICVRLDGRAFHTFTRGLDRPFDHGLTQAMIETTKYLVEETNAKVGYTQSDEITLVLWNEDYSAEPLFGGKVFKLTSVLASLATAKFNSLVPTLVPSKADKLATFDARVFQVPSLEEAASLVLWRWLDARKNSISMAAQAVFSHNELTYKDGPAKLAMLAMKGIDWNDYPSRFKWGTFVQRKTAARELTPAELSKIPEKHRPTGPVVRSACVEIDLPPLLEISNRADVLFRAVAPTLRISE